MLAFLLSLVNPVSRIVDKIAPARLAAEQAKSDEERIAAEERAKALEARRDVLVAESGSRVNGLVRAGFALPFVIYNAKLMLWDKVFSLGATDALSPELFQIEIAVIGFYFLYDIAARLRR
jgi:hypothetical protein